jgi:hypothetical protein
VWSPVYGDAWRPYDKDYYPGADWQPYRYGRWRDISGDLFWVPDEAWGWVPYHLGFWVWDPELGWIWVPGRYFAPAWVSWFHYQGLVAWRPRGFWDWYRIARSSLCLRVESPGGSCTCRPPSPGGGTAVPRPGRPSPPPSPPVEGDGDEPRRPPLEHRRAYDRLIARLSEGDESARHLVVVREAQRKVGPVRETIPRGREISEDISTGLPERARFPGQNANFLAETAALARAVEPSPAETAGVAREASNRQGEPSPPAIALPSEEGSTPRFRDWNPDVRAAHRLGATLTYSSVTNEVRCSELAAAQRERLGGWNGAGGSWSGSGPGGSGSSGGSGGGHGAGTPAGNRDGGGPRGDRAK